MTIHCRWLVKNQVILSHFVDEVGTQQVLDYIDKSFAMRDAANEINGKFGPLVHTITDATELTEQKIDFSTARKIMSSLREQRVGWSLYVGSNKIDQFFAAMAHQFAGVRYKTFSSVEEAISFLKETDESLREPLSKPLNLGINETSSTD